MLTLTAVSPAYNGAWWFVTTYIILVLVSPMINKIVIKANSYLIIIISFLFYSVAYVQRIKGVIVFDNVFLNWIIRQLAIFGTSQFPFIIGAIFANKKIYSKLYKLANKIECKNLLGVMLIIFMIVGHGVIETLFVAVFTEVDFIYIFNLIDKPRWLNKLLNYLSNHSTNMWLTHMFFYMIYFKKLVFAPKYSFLIFPWLIIMCLISSYLINLIYKPIITLLNSKIELKKKSERLIT